MKGFSTPQEFVNSLNWYGKQKDYRRSNGGNVSVRKNKSGYQFVFREDTFKHFKSGTIMISITDDCILFKDGGKDGVKLSDTPNPNTKSTRFYNKALTDALRTFEGDYEMKYLKQVDLYYITKGEEEDE